jgi:hypothetical protein
MYLMVIDDTPLKKYIATAQNQSPKDRGQTLAHFDPILSAHNSFAMIGNDTTTEEEESVDFHYIAFVPRRRNAGLFICELDGCKSSPVDCGSTTEENFFQVPIYPDHSMLNDF